jgi:hypothetical protein
MHEQFGRAGSAVGDEDVSAACAGRLPWGTVTPKIVRFDLSSNSTGPSVLATTTGAVTSRSRCPVLVSQNVKRMFLIAAPLSSTTPIKIANLLPSGAIALSPMSLEPGGPGRAVTLNPPTSPSSLPDCKSSTGLWLL